MIPNRTIEVSRLVDFLQPQEHGARVTYEELSELIHMDARKEGRGKVTSAKRIMEKQHNKIWITVTGVGIQLANDSEIVLESSKHLTRAHRAAKRGVKKVGIANYEALDKDGRQSFMAIKTVGMFISSLGSKKNKDALNKKMPVENGAIMPNPKDVLTPFLK